MKVAYINTVFGIKSTGRTYAELKLELEKKGHECKAFFGVGESDVANTYKIGNKITYWIHNVLSRIVGLQGYFSYLPTKKLIKQLEEFNPDIVHMGCLHGNYLNLPTLFRYLKKSQKAVFITTHDCWNFTGGCVYFTRLGCDRYTERCHNCPAKKLYPTSYFFDFSTKIYNDKKKWFQAIENMNVICVSNWMYEQVIKSFFNNKNVVTNYNWIDTNVFKPLIEFEREEIRKKYGVSENEFLIIATSAHWKKGTPRYEDLSKLMTKLKDNQKLLVVGLVQDEFPENKNVKFASFVSDVSYLAKLYAAADVYVHFSVEDTFGKVIAEAQACGTPAIVYDATACPEVAKIGGGYVITPRDVDGVYNKIEELSKLSKEEKITKRQDCAERTRNVLSKDRCAESLIALYENAIK